MRLIFVRHAEPDYSIDSLTANGWKEAELLADRMEKIETAAYYCSPLGRAKDTAGVTLKRVNRTAEICDWLCEFGVSAQKHLWDYRPEAWINNPDATSFDNWFRVYPFSDEVKARYDYVTKSFEECLAKHGYHRQGKIYTTEQGNDETIVFFCHFGLECVLLSYLFEISPFLLWHITMAPPSSLTIVNTEEREKGQVVFRLSSYGDTSHLYPVKEPSFSGRFCSVFENKNELH